jgi:branched-subunit amino acid ABC-type transport system permease component
VGDPARRTIPGWVEMTATLTGFVGIDSGREIAQAIVDGIISGASYALLGIAFALILGVTGRFHFAFGILYTLSAYIAALGVGPWGLPLIPAALVGLAVGVALGVLVEYIVYRPLATRAGESALLTVFVASLGLMIAGENAIRLIWGNEARNLGGFPDHTYSVAGAHFSLIELVLVLVAIAVALLLTVVLDRTIFGQQIRAVRGNPDMAQAVGVNLRRVFLMVFAVGSLIGGIAALFAGMRFAAAPDMGNTPVFYAFVVAFVAGVARSPIVVGAVGLLFGVAERISTLWVSDNLSALAVFGLLFLWLTIRVLPRAIRQLSGAMSPRAS